MLYPNLITACDCLGHELYSFCGHSVNPTHTSFMHDKLCRAVDYLSKETAAVSVEFDAEVWLNAKAMPAVVTISGTNVFEPLDLAIALKK